MGSSPLTRGKHESGMFALAWGGLIPAHAGKTPVIVVSGCACGAHPRSRGENACASAHVVRVGGSSPLTRGKHIENDAGQGLGGLIPAHAGKTSVTTTHGGARRAHPRSRGENRMQARRTRLRPGSSPLTRGKRVTRASRSRRWGLIPAHAGKTPEGHRPPEGPRAHPRSRGENRRLADEVEQA